MRLPALPAAFRRTYLRGSVVCLSLGAALLTGSGFRPAPLVARAAFRSVLPPDTVARQLRGRVFDAYTQEPLPAASLWLKQLALGAQSDEQGYFVFELTTEQLAAAPVDTLQVQARAFRSRNLAIAFAQQPADSLLRLVVQRDSIVTQPKPLPAVPRREARRLGKSNTRPLPKRPSD